MKLIDITKENWENVILLSTNEHNQLTLEEEFVASNAYSLVESFYEENWIVRAIELNGTMIGFAMYGFPEGSNACELRRFMIDRRFQGKGYGKQALSLIVEEMRGRYSCKEIFLSTEAANVKGKHVYESAGFLNTGKIQDGEELYMLKIS